MALYKVTLTVDQQWLGYLQQAAGMIERGEVFRTEAVEDLNVPACLSCDMSDMDEYACPEDEGYCVDCCTCEEHRAQDALGSWRD